MGQKSAVAPILVGCEPGEYYAIVSAKHGAAILDLRAPGKVAVGSDRADLLSTVNSLEGRLVLWHHGPTTSFYGWYDPQDFAHIPRPHLPGTSPTEEMCIPMLPEGPVAEYRGPVMQAIAAAVKIPATGILFLAYGYQQFQGWTVHTVTPTGMKIEPLRSYRERLGRVEGL